MRVVLDEGVPRQLAEALRRVGLPADRFKAGWEQMSNGTLIRAAEAAGYAVLLTNDKNIVAQQILAGRAIAIVALPLNRRSAIMARVDDIADTIRLAKPGQHIAIGLDGTRRVTGFVGGQTVAEDLPSLPPFDPRP